MEGRDGEQAFDSWAGLLGQVVTPKLPKSRTLFFKSAADPNKLITPRRVLKSQRNVHPQSRQQGSIAVMDEVTNRMARVDFKQVAPKPAENAAAVALLRSVKELEGKGDFHQALDLLRAAEKQHVTPLHSIIQCRLDMERRMQACQHLDCGAVRRAVSGLCTADEEPRMTPEGLHNYTAMLPPVLEFDSGLTGRTMQHMVATPQTGGSIHSSSPQLSQQSQQCTPPAASRETLPSPTADTCSSIDSQAGQGILVQSVPGATHLPSPLLEATEGGVDLLAVSPAPLPSPTRAPVSSISDSNVGQAARPSLRGHGSHRRTRLSVTFAEPVLDGLSEGGIALQGSPRAVLSQPVSDRRHPDRHISWAEPSLEPPSGAPAPAVPGDPSRVAHSLGLASAVTPSSCGGPHGGNPDTVVKGHTTPSRPGGLTPEESHRLSLNAGHTPGVSPCPSDEGVSLADTLTLGLDAGHTPAASRSSSCEPPLSARPECAVALLAQAAAETSPGATTRSLHAGCTPAPPPRASGDDTELLSPADTARLSLHAGNTPAVSRQGSIEHAQGGPRGQTPVFATAAASEPARARSSRGKRGSHDVTFAATTELLAPAAAPASTAAAAAVPATSHVADGRRPCLRASLGTVAAPTPCEAENVTAALVFHTHEAARQNGAGGKVMYALEPPSGGGARRPRRRVTFDAAASGSVPPDTAPLVTPHELQDPTHMRASARVTAMEQIPEKRNIQTGRVSHGGPDAAREAGGAEGQVQDRGASQQQPDPADDGSAAAGKVAAQESIGLSFGSPAFRGFDSHTPSEASTPSLPHSALRSVGDAAGSGGAQRGRCEGPSSPLLTSPLSVPASAEPRGPAGRRGMPAMRTPLPAAPSPMLSSYALDGEAALSSYALPGEADLLDEGGPEAQGDSLPQRVVCTEHAMTPEPHGGASAEAAEPASAATDGLLADDSSAQDTPDMLRLDTPSTPRGTGSAHALGPGGGRESAGAIATPAPPARPGLAAQAPLTVPLLTPQEGTPGMALRSGGRLAAARRALPPAVASVPRELRALLDDEASLDTAGQGFMGLHEVLAPVKATSAKQRDLLGSGLVLTPVRRSARHSVAACNTDRGDPDEAPCNNVASQLEGTNWAYSPNPALAGLKGADDVTASMSRLNMRAPRT